MSRLLIAALALVAAVSSAGWAMAAKEASAAQGAQEANEAEAVACQVAKVEARRVEELERARTEMERGRADALAAVAKLTEDYAVCRHELTGEMPSEEEILARLSTSTARR